MKKFTLTLTAIVALAQFANSQSNTFPASGNVGIGSTSSLDGVLNVTVPFGKTTSYLGSPNNAVFFRTNDATAPFSLRFQIVGAAAIADRRASIQTTDIFSEDGGILSLQPAAGNVGLGTNVPLSLFQVDDGCTKANIGDASGSGLNYGTSYLGFNAARNSGNWTMHSDSHSNGGGLIYSNIHGEMYFAPIASTGSITQTLSDATVRGRIALRIDSLGVTHAKKVKIEITGWPDYVFKPSYRLMPLSQVKSYIELNHHLPDMPSDKEVEGNGLDVGELNKLLTKKVEELTLYLIRQQKLVESMEKRINKLEAKHSK